MCSEIKGNTKLCGNEGLVDLHRSFFDGTTSAKKEEEEEQNTNSIENGIASYWNSGKTANTQTTEIIFVINIVKMENVLSCLSPFSNKLHSNKTNSIILIDDDLYTKIVENNIYKVNG